MRPMRTRARFAAIRRWWLPLAAVPVLLAAVLVPELAVAGPPPAAPAAGPLLAPRAHIPMAACDGPACSAPFKTAEELHIGIAPGDLRVRYVPLEGAPISQLFPYEGGAAVITGEASAGYVLHRFHADGTLTHEPVDLPLDFGGDAAPIASAGPVFAIGRGDDVIAHWPDGHAGTLHLPSPLTTTQSQDSPRYIQWLSASGDHLYAVRNNEQAIYAVRITGGVLVLDGRIATPDWMPPPNVVLQLPDGRLLAWASYAFEGGMPAGVLSLLPGGVLIDRADGSMTTVAQDSAAIPPELLAGARVAATAAFHTPVITFDRSPGAGAIDLDTRDAVLGETAWGGRWSSPGAGQLAWQGPSGDTATFQLPTFEYIPSCPAPPPGQPPDCPNVRQGMVIAGAVALPSGALVFLSNNQAFLGIAWP